MFEADYGDSVKLLGSNQKIGFPGSAYRNLIAMKQLTSHSGVNRIGAGQHLTSKATLFAVCVASVVTMAQADPFIMAPEIYAPVWNTPFPYQRNINMGFDINPATAPNPSGIPGAVYEGTLDPSLMSSDAVAFTGAASWYGSLPGITQTGLIGIDNRTGNTTLTGTVVFTIDDTTVPLPDKNVWIEALGITSAGPDSVGVDVFDPNNNEAKFLGGPGVSSYNNEYLSDYEFQISPNPDYETVVEYFTVPAGDYALLDNLHIATECVPEPASFSLLALGLGTLAFLRRQRK